jgi:hypothetical protein
VEFGTLGSLSRAGFDLDATIGIVGDLVVGLATAEMRAR